MQTDRNSFCIPRQSADTKDHGERNQSEVDTELDRAEGAGE
jgi:hypothetical protein